MLCSAFKEIRNYLLLRVLNTAEPEYQWKWEGEEEEDRKVRRKWRSVKKTHNSIQSIMILDKQLNELQGRLLSPIWKLNELNIPVWNQEKWPSFCDLEVWAPHVLQGWTSADHHWLTAEPVISEDAAGRRTGFTPSPDSLMSHEAFSHRWETRRGLL